jgi:deazaflavin-dependent oxidoreductase (nitroreductase family)
MMDQNKQHDQLIKEFRANAGKVGGPFEGAPLLLLTTLGARSGEHHTTPLRYLLNDKHGWIVFAANAGASSNPAWYYNLLSHPMVTIEVEMETVEAMATVLTGEERERLLALQTKAYPHFATYTAQTNRPFPVIALQRRGETRQ